MHQVPDRLDWLAILNARIDAGDAQLGPKGVQYLFNRVARDLPAELAAHLVFRDGAVLVDDLKRMRSQRLFAAKTGIGRNFRIAVTDQRVEEWKFRGGDEQRCIVTEGNFEGRLLTQQTHDKFCGGAGIGVSKSLLGIWQL